MWVRRLGLAVFVVLLLALAWRSATRPVDFPIYHRIATQVLHGDFELYPTTFNESGPAHSFRYAPAVAFLFVPLAWLPLEAAAFLFFCLKVVALVYVGQVVARQVGVPTRCLTLILTSLLVVGGYLVEEFRNGNFHFFSVALMVLAFDAVARGKVAVPATALALAIATKLTPVALLAYFALRRRFAMCLATVVALVILAVLPAAVVGWEANNRLARGFVANAVQKIDEEGNYSLRGVVFRYLTPDHREDASYPRTSLAGLSAQAASALWFAMVVVGGIGLAAVLWRESPGPTGRLVEFSIVLTAMLLASPHTQRQHLTALCVPVLTLLALRARSPLPSLRLPVTVGLAITAAAGTLLPLVLGSRRLALIYEAASPYFFATLILLVTLVLLTGQLKVKEPHL